MKLEANNKKRAIIFEYREAPEHTLCALPSICFTPFEILSVMETYEYSPTHKSRIKKVTEGNEFLFNEEIDNFETYIYGTLGVFEPDNIRVRYFSVSDKVLPRYLVVSSSLDFRQQASKLRLDSTVLNGFESYSQARQYVKQKLATGIECFIRPRLITDAISVLSGEKIALPLIDSRSLTKKGNKS